MRVMFPWMSTILVAARSAAGLALFSGLSAVGSAQDGRLEFEVETIGGRTITDEDFEKSILIADLWGTWCEPCRETVPALQALYAKYKHHGLEIVGFAYEAGGADPAAAVRDFAVKHGVTYSLALGTPQLKRQVKQFNGYPTMMLFGRGYALARTQTGFTKEDAPELENWIRAELGLEPIEHPAEPVEEQPANVPAVVPANADQPLNLPQGVIFQPGDGDKGFDFRETDIDGKALSFGDFRGKPVVLALTSTWDASAAQSAKLLQALHEEYGDKAHVLAASLELRASKERKLAKIRKFCEDHKVSYRVFPAGIGFQKKIYQFSGMPMFLVFDPEGVLILREAGTNADAEAGKELDATAANIRQAVAGHLGG